MSLRYKHADNFYLQLKEKNKRHLTYFNYNITNNVTFIQNFYGILDVSWKKMPRFPRASMDIGFFNVLAIKYHYVSIWIIFSLVQLSTFELNLTPQTGRFRGTRGDQNI